MQSNRASPASPRLHFLLMLGCWAALSLCLSRFWGARIPLAVHRAGVHAAVLLLVGPWRRSVSSRCCYALP